MDRGGQSAARAPHALASRRKAGALSVTADLLYTADNFRGGDYIISARAGFPIPKAPKATLDLNQPWSRNFNHTLRGVVGARYELFPGGSISLRYGHAYYFEDIRSVGSQIIDSAGDLSGTAVGFAGGSKTDVADATFRAKFDTGGLEHALIAVANSYYTYGNGGDYYFGDSYDSNIYHPIFYPKPAELFSDATTKLLTTPLTRSTNKLQGYAIADSITALDGLLIGVVGVRYQTLDTIDYADLSKTISDRYKKNKFTPAVGLTVKPTVDWSIYASFSQGLTPGPYAPGGTINAGTIFAPFVSTQYEFGTKVDWGKLIGAPDWQINLFSE